MRHPYARPAYAASLGHIGMPLDVPEWGSSVLVRAIPGGGQDATGCYPLAIMASDADLRGGLERLKGEGLVSVTLVVDDVHRPGMAAMTQAFDVVRPYKTHYLRRRDGAAISRHHRADVLRAQRKVTTGRLDLRAHAADWMRLYDVLIVRHGLSDLHLFPSSHVEALASSAGIEAIGAWAGDDLVSAHIWVEHEGQVYSHLAASSATGYASGAAYAVYAASFEHFRNAVAINLGGVAGHDDSGGGLSRFKAGFANATAQSWLCGAILDGRAFTQLSPHGTLGDFFPPYRGKG